MIDEGFAPNGLPGPLFTVLNRHTPQRSHPPVIEGNDPSLYCGCFENCCREQFVLVYRKDSSNGILYAGDAGWKSSLFAARLSARSGRGENRRSSRREVVRYSLKNREK